MAARLQDLFVNILGIQSVSQFGAQQAIYHPDADAVDSADCSAFVLQTPETFEWVSLAVVRNNLAVVPDWSGDTVGSSWLNAQSLDSSFAGCVQNIKSASFVSFHDDFLAYIGPAAKMKSAQVFTGEEAGHVHEAPIYVSELEEFIFADTSAVGWLWGLMLKHSETTTRKIFTHPKLHNVNGGTYHNGKLYLTTNGGRSPGIHECTLPSYRYSSDTINCKTIVNNYRLTHLNSPNDLIFTSQGNILFTDPTYGWTQSWPGVGAPELPTTVYHFNMKTRALVALTTEPNEPNGLALSPGEKTLYVADSNSTSGKPVRVWDHSVRNVLAYDWDESSLRLTNQRLVHVVERGWPDGLRISTSKQGKQLLFVAGMGGVDVVDISRGGAGTLIGKFNVGDDVIFNLEPTNSAKTEWHLTGKKAVYKVNVSG